ncbi:hypothetical protein Dimus_000061 [Dionaea muscipula]
MMAIGSSYGGIGSSASSNLSASAPPFTVDKSISKPNSKPRVNYPDMLYASLLNPPPQIQESPYKPNAEPSFTDPKPVANGLAPLPSLYGFLDSQVSNSTGNHFVPLNKDPFEPYMNDQYSSGLPTSFVETKSYYSPYVSPLNDYAPAQRSEAKYDLLSDSVTAQVSGLSQVDYAPSASPLEYSSPWAGFWNEGSDGKQGGDSFYSKGYEFPDLSWCKSYTEQGVEGAMSFSMSYPRNDYFESSRPFAMGSTSGYQGSPHTIDLAKGSMPNSWAQKPYTTKVEKFGGSSGPFAVDKLPAKSSPVVVRSPFSGKSSSDQSAVAPKELNCVSNKDVDITKRPYTLDAKSDDKGAPDHQFIEKSAPLSPDLNCCDFLKLKPEGADALCSVEKTSDSPDIHNPAVDSPCWKGATSARFSPFETPDLVGPEHLLKDLDACSSLGDQAFHNQVPNTAGAVHICEKMNGSSSDETPLVIEKMLPGQGDCASMKQGICFPELNAKLEAMHRIQFVGDNKKSGKELHKEEADGDSKVSFTADQSEQQGESSSDGMVDPLALGTPGKSGEHTGVALKEGFCTSPSNCKDDLSSVRSRNVATSMVGKPLGRDSNPTMDVCLLINTMKNLSEMLSYHCSNNPAAITEQDHTTLSDVVTNIHSCLRPERAAQSTRCKEVLIQERTPSSDEDVSHVPLSASLGSTRLRKISAADVGRVNFVNLLKDKEISAVGSRRNNLQEPISLKGTKDTAGDAVSRLLYDYFPVEEELDGWALFYKKLWLEAEAALCCFNVHTRFRHMKIEMENCVHSGKVDGTNEGSSSIVSPDMHGVAELGSRAKDGLDFGARSHVYSRTSRACHSVEFDTSVMDRFQILSSRVEKFEAKEVEGQDSPADPIDELEASATSRAQEIPECDVGSSGLMTFADQMPPSRVKSGQGFGAPDKMIREILRPASLEAEGDAEASVFARFNILKSRIDRLNSGDEDPQRPVVGEKDGMSDLRNIIVDRIQGQLPQFGAHAQSCEADGTEEPYCFEFKAHARSSQNHEGGKKVNQSFVSPVTWGLDLLPQVTMRPQVVEQGNEKRFNLPIPPRCTDATSVSVLEGWYDCPLPSSDWEHVSKEDFCGRSDRI